MRNIIIHHNRLKSAMNRHPWIYSGSIKSADKNIADGDMVKVISPDNKFICYGHYNSKSKIAVRAFCWEESVIPDNAYVEILIKKSLARRSQLSSNSNTSCFRLIFSESDFLPGVIADFYNGYISVSFNTVSSQMNKKTIAEILIKETGALGLAECTSPDFLKKEGITSIIPLIICKIPEIIRVQENGIFFNVDILNGQKTGFYTDQRENRKFTAEFSPGKEILDVFCYTGGFTLNFLNNNASHVTSVDSSASALERLEESLSLNGFDSEKHTSIRGDAFSVLKEMTSAGRNFDLIVLDPPKLAPSRHSLTEALRAYKELNLSAMRLVRSHGQIAAFSCSQAVSLETLKEVIRWASIDSGRNIVIHSFLSQPEDHPVLATFPESEYLKGIIYSVY